MTKRNLEGEVRNLWYYMWLTSFLIFLIFFIGNQRTIINEKNKEEYKLFMMMKNKKMRFTSMADSCKENQTYLT